MLQGNSTKEIGTKFRTGWWSDTALGTVKTGRKHRRSQVFQLLASCWKDLLSCLFCEVQCKSLLFEEENTQAALLFFTVLESSLKV